MTNLILIDSRVQGVDDILSALTPNTESLVFDYTIDTIESIQARIQRPYSSVAIAQHNYKMPIFNLFMAMESAYITDVANVDPELESWKYFIDFLQWLKQNGAINVDLLACELWSNSNWVYAIEKMRSKLELSIRASIDITGVDGNFVLESDNVDMIGIYFTMDILKYKYNFYTNSTPDEPNGQLGYTPIIFSAANPGYLPATAYNSILGGITSSFVQLSSDISNVLMVSMTRHAVAVLQTNGNVIAFGDPKYGGNTSVVASQLYNITKIISTMSWFTALRSDGKVISWGGGTYRSGIDINNWTNNGNGDPLLSDVSNSLVNVVDIYSNSSGSFALTASGGVYGWGTNPFGMANFTQIKSGIVKVISSDSHIVAINSSGVAYYFRGTFIMSSAANSNPIVDAYVFGSSVIYVRTASSNTKQIININSTVLYTIPSGVYIIRVESYSNNFLVLLSNNILLNIVGGTTTTAINNVTDIATTSIAYAYLQNNILVVSGNAGWGGSLTHSNHGVSNDTSLTNIRRLVSSNRAIGALKYDNTFIWWGLLEEPYGSSFYPTLFKTEYPALHSAISSNIASVYGNNQGFIFTKNDGTIITLGPTSWGGEVKQTTRTGAKRENKNVGFIPNINGFIAVENTPTVTSLLSQYYQYTPTTLTYYNNNPDVMALRGRKYSVMVGNYVAGTWICPVDSFTYTFTDVVFIQGGSITISICDTPNYTSSYSVMGSFNATITENPSISPPDPPTITSVVIGTQQLTVNFTSPSWNGGLSIIGYKYSINGGQTYTTLPVTSNQFVLTGLTGSSYTIWLLSTTYAGDSYYTEYNALIYNAPSSPTISNVTLGNQQVVLNVSTSNNGGGAITGYKYAFSSSGPYTNFNVNPSSETTSHTITGLLNNTPYSLYVKATNGAGDSPSTIYGPFTLNKTVPNSPTITSVSALDSSIKVVFAAPYNGGDSITEYKYTVNGGSEVSIGLVDSSFVIPNLINGTSYVMNMKAVNSIGTSLSSATSSAVVPKTVPGAPTISSVTPGNQQVSVAFTAPASNGGSVITQYNYRLNGGSAVAISGITSPFTITGLTNGSSYTITMTAVNVVGESALSAVSDLFIPSTIPSTPVIQSIVAGNQSISVNFIVDNGGSALTTLQYSINDASNVSIETTSSPLVINGLINGTAYRLKIRVSNANGTTSMSNYSSYATPVTIPGSPIINSVEPGNQYVQFEFSPPEDDGSSAITGYKYSLNGGVFSPIGLVQSPYRITQYITNGISYYVQLIATNAVGDSESSAVSNSVVPCKIPDAPTIVSVQNGDQEVTINLSSGNNGGSEISYYTYSFGDSNSTPVVVNSLYPLTFSNLTVGTVYSFQIKATNGVGDSSYASTNVTGMSNPNAPVIINAIPGNKSIVLEFSAPNSNSSPITEYKYSITNGVYLTATLLDDSHISVPNLNATTEYSVKLAAVNAIGQSDDSNTVTSTPYTNPLAPTIGEIAVDNGSASVEFYAQSDNGSHITEYEYSLNNGNYILYSSIESPLVLSDLSNGVAYTIKMKAKNVAGSSLVASSATFMPRTVPEAPTIISVTASNQSCIVEFSPGFFNGSVITKYRYSFNGVDFQDAIGTVSPITIDGLTNGNTYMVYLLAVNIVGESNISAVSSSFVPFVTQSTPNPPVDLYVISGNRSVTVSFTDGVNQGSAIKGYMYSFDGGITRFWAKQIESPLVIDGLENGVEKSIQLYAVNNSGPSELSEASELFTPCAVPDAPILTGVQGADESIVLSFIPGSSNGAEISAYEYSLNGGTTYSTLMNDSTIYGLTNGTSYTVKLRAVNSVGPSLSSALSQSVIPYSVPDAPIITSVSTGDGSISIVFTPGNSNGSSISRYEYALISNGETSEFNTASSIGSPIIIKGLDNGTGYRIILRAVTNFGEFSEYSVMSDEVFPGNVPTKPIITKLQPGNETIIVNWVTNTNGSLITSVLYNLNGGSYVSAPTTDTSFTIPSLVNGSAYSIRLIAVNSHGSSIPSLESDSVTPLSKPEPPTINSIVPGDTKVQIFLTPGNTNGSNFIGYKYSLDGTSYNWIKEKVSPISIYDLSNGTSYNIHLQSVGESVGGSSSVELPSVVPYKSPDAPIIQAISVGNRSAAITFVNGNTNGLTLTGYKYSLDAINYIDISAVNNIITLPLLTNGNTYTVSLKSVTSVAISAPSVISAPFMPYTDPSPPSISKIVTGDQTASIYVTDGSANGSGVTIAYRYTFDNTTYYWASSSTSPIVISSGLVNNQGYKISVAVKTNLGMSAFSAQSTTFVPYTLPSAPTITNVVPGNGVVSLYFTDGSSNGRPITSYQYTINGIVYSAVTGTSPLLISGLTNGTSYTVTLKSANLAGYSSASIASNVFVPFSVPSACTITNLVPSTNQITVYVSPGNTNGSPITNFSYSLNGGSYVSTNSSTLSFVIPNLVNGTSYTVAVKAENAAGFGAASATSNSIVPFTVPDAPTITGVTVGNGSATVAITNGNNNGRIATQYQYSYTSSYGTTTLTTSTSSTQLSSLFISGLTNWTNYTVTVKAINVAGMSSASEVSDSFMPYNIPGAPVIASVVPGNASIVVNIDGLTIGSGVVGYKYSFDNVSYTYKSGVGTSFTITGLQNATSYQVYVKSVTSQGDSPSSIPSNSVVPFTVPNAPTISSIVSGNKTISIYITNSSNNGSNLINYEYSVDGVKYIEVDPVSPIVLNNLVNWQSYSYYVRSVNIAGSSLPSVQSSSVVPFLVPTSAVISSITPSDCQLIVNMDGWTSESGIIGYKYSLDNGDLVYVSSSSASFVISGLVNGQDYVVRVKSSTTAGDSPLSSPYLPIHPSAAPNAPLNVVVNPLNESAVITFTDGSTNGEPIQYYMYSLNGSIDTPIFKRADGSLKIFGISNAVNYSVRLKAVNNTGVSHYSETSNTFMPFGIPVVHPVITRILPGNGCVYVYFSEADTNGSPLTKFKWTDGSKTYDVYGTESPLTISGLVNKKPCSISIASCNLVGDSPFTTAITIVPGVPLAPVITNVVSGPKKLLVYFDVPENNGFAISSYLYGFEGSTAFVKGTSASTTSVSPLQILNLKNGTPYNVRILASNQNGNSIASNSIGNKIPCEPPAKVTIASVNSLFDGALVTFTTPLNNGTPLLKYKYALNTSTTYTDASGLTLPLRIYDISPNTTNTIKIIATNAAGDSIESLPSKPFTFVYRPPSQVKVTALTITLNQLTVTFLPPVINGSPIIKYKYALDASGVLGTFVDASGITLPLTIIDGVLPNVSYNVRIIAVNNAGESIPSLPVSKPVLFTYLPPLAPTISSIVAGDRSALVNFTGLPARGAPITGYSYTLDASATTIYDVSGAVSQLTIPELTNDVSYNVRIAAITPIGRSAWSLPKPVIPVYKIPNKPVISNVIAGNEQLTVTFTVPAANGSPITGYKYVINSGEKVEISNIIRGNSFIITGLINGTLYNVQMCATNILGDSDLSTIKPGTPKS